MEQVHEPDLSDLLALHKKDIMNSLNCHAIGLIDSYNAQTKTCKASIVYKKSIQKLNPANNQYVTTLQDYPIIINCPVINHGGGGTGIRFPIKKGDVALILFNDRDIDNWFIGKQTNGQTATKRTHHFSDGVALVGLFSKNDAQKDYDALEASKTYWFNGTTKIVLGDKIKIENATANLALLMGQLIDAISTYAPNTTTPGNPTVPNPAQVAVLTTIKTQLLGLLE